MTQPDSATVLVQDLRDFARELEQSEQWGWDELYRKTLTDAADLIDSSCKPAFKCEAVIYSGPGHQSKSHCTQTEPHPIEGEHSVTEVVRDWTGPTGYAEYWG